MKFRGRSALNEEYKEETHFLSFGKKNKYAISFMTMMSEKSPATYNAQ